MKTQPGTKSTFGGRDFGSAARDRLHRYERTQMGATLVLAIWIASTSTFQAALPFGGQYQIREFANADSGIDDFITWTNAPGHDKIDMICVAISGAERSKAAQFWREAEVKRIIYMNLLQIEVLAGNPLIATVTAITIAEACAEMLPPSGTF